MDGVLRFFSQEREERTFYNFGVAKQDRTRYTMGKTITQLMPATRGRQSAAVANIHADCR